jgi:hypothetical protein
MGRMCHFGRSIFSEGTTLPSTSLLLRRRTEFVILMATRAVRVVVAVLAHLGEIQFHNHVIHWAFLRKVIPC